MAEMDFALYKMGEAKMHFYAKTRPEEQARALFEKAKRIYLQWRRKTNLVMDLCEKSVMRLPYPPKDPPPGWQRAPTPPAHPPPGRRNKTDVKLVPTPPAHPPPGWSAKSAFDLLDAACQCSLKPGDEAEDELDKWLDKWFDAKPERDDWLDCKVERNDSEPDIPEGYAMPVVPPRGYDLRPVVRPRGYVDPKVEPKVEPKSEPVLAEPDAVNARPKIVKGGMRKPLQIKAEYKKKIKRGNRVGRGNRAGWKVQAARRARRQALQFKAERKKKTIKYGTTKEEPWQALQIKAERKKKTKYGTTKEELATPPWRRK